jgi:hypothetical protein
MAGGPSADQGPRDASWPIDARHLRELQIQISRIVHRPAGRLRLTFVWAGSPTAFACSCIQITIGELDPVQNQVYVATAAQATPLGTPMAVERWFIGPGAAPVVVLGPASFGDSAGCGTDPFPPGSRWIVSTWAGDPTQPPTTGLCQPHAQLDTPEGQAMLRGRRRVRRGIGAGRPRCGTIGDA